MAAITVAVPVFNGMPLIETSLSTLARQTFGDIEFVIHDNGSTDGTSDIAASFAAKDARFRHLRRPSTIPVRENFLKSLEAATSPFFAWRAYDDVSDDDYFEKLHALLVADERLALAAGRVKVVYQDRPEKIEEVVGLDLPEGLRRTSMLLNHALASWIYGLWRREPLLDAFRYTIKTYEPLGGFDNLILFQAIYPGRFAGTNATTFTQRRRTFTAKTRKNAMSQDERWALLWLFHKCCRDWASAHVPPAGPIDAWRRELAILRFAFHKNQKLHKFLLSRRNLPLAVQRMIGYREA